MKTKIGITLVAMFTVIFGLQAQDIVTVEAKNYDVSDNLDLEAVASIFGDAKDLEDFERRLNDPEAQLSNLDLNQDGYVDYLRVIESSSTGVYLITIQAVIGKDLYQDVATIDVQKDQSGNVSVQVVGDVYMYGSNYIIEPVYVYRPVIYTYFWAPRHRVWVSPYYWGYYPRYYRRWAPCAPYAYHQHINVYVNHNHSYHYTSNRKSEVAANLHYRSRRNDYGVRNPTNSFQNRNEGVRNKRELAENRGSASNVGTRSANTQRPSAVKSTGRKVDSDWAPANRRANGSTRNVSKEVSVPAERSVTRTDRTERNTASPANVSRSTAKPQRSTKSEPVRRQSSPGQTGTSSRPATRPVQQSKSSSRSSRVTRTPSPAPAAKPANSNRGSSQRVSPSPSKAATRTATPTNSGRSATKSSTKAPAGRSGR